MSHAAVALVFFILGFWFAGLELWPVEKFGRTKKKSKRKSNRIGYSFDSEGRPLDE